MVHAFTAPDGTRYTLAELHARIVEVEPAIFHFRELPTSTGEIFRAMHTHMADRAHARPVHAQPRPWACIMDLTDATSRPQGSYKEAIHDALSTATRSHSAMVQPGSFLLRTVLRFLSASRGDTSVHATYGEALAACRAYVDQEVSS